MGDILLVLTHWFWLNLGKDVSVTSLLLFGVIILIMEVPKSIGMSGGLCTIQHTVLRHA